jgi:SpoVK/Ycf46/Vps4 family AAA+-type ATPase
MARQKLNEVMDRLLMLIRSGYPVIYVVSYEESRVLEYLAKIVRVVKHEKENPGKNLVRWCEGIGFQQMPDLIAAPPQGSEIDWLTLEGIPATQPWRPLAADRDVGSCLTAVRDATIRGFPMLCDAVTVFYDLHPYLRGDLLSPPGGSQVRMLRNTADALRFYYDTNRTNPERRYKTVVVVAPAAEGLSMELERDIIKVDFPLPETDELRAQLNAMLGSGRLHLPANLDKEQQDRLCDMIAAAGRGLTLEDYKRGLSMFAVRGQELSKEHVEDMLDLKAKAINNRALEYTPHVDIDLGGLEGVKEWIRQRRDAAVSEDVRNQYYLPALKGVMLCGASGGGKSQLAKLIAKEFNLALLRLDVGALFGSYVGESEQRTREALMLAEVLAPIVLWIDEVDKAFAGIGAGGDNGVSARVFGTFLTWLAEKEDSVFVVTTANDFTRMLKESPEFSRKGRFDELFWIGLPGPDEREAIFRIYLEPHHQTGYFDVTAQDVQGLAPAYGIHQYQLTSGEDPFRSFCRLLARDEISTKMTGAEIEHSVKEALFEAYDLRDRATGKARLTPDIITQAVKRLADHALYLPGSEDGAKLIRLEGESQKRGWPKAGD